MAHKDELVGSKIQSNLAAILGDDLSTGLTATGSNQGGALALSASCSKFSTVSASTGAILPTASGKGEYAVFNGGASPLSVYPAVGETINGSSANTAFSVTNGKSAIFKPVGQTWIAVLSA